MSISLFLLIFLVATALNGADYQEKSLCLCCFRQIVVAMITQTILVGLLQNATILISSVLLYDYFWVSRQPRYKWRQQVLTGFVLILIGILLINTSWYFAPGIFFDTRSILLSVSGLFLGIVPTAICIVGLAIYRLMIGGPGQLMGLSVILASGLIGIFWGWLKTKPKMEYSWYELLLFGVIVHLGMLLSSFLLPGELQIPTLKVMTIPILIVYPFGTMLTALFIQRFIKNWGYKKQLIESRALYLSLVNQMPAGVFRKSIEGKYEFVNQRFCEIIGLQEADIIGKMPVELSNDCWLDKNANDNHHDWILQHGLPVIVEEKYARPNAQPFYYQVIKTPIFDAEETIVGTQGMLFDITQLKQTENSLMSEQEQLKIFLDNTPDRIYFKDNESRIIRFNKAYAEAMGIEDERDVLGKTDFDIFSSEHALNALADEQQIMRTGVSLINKEEKETWPDGRITWAITSKFPLKDKEDKIIGTFGVSNDVTAYKELEQELVGAKLKAEESDQLKTAFLHNISHEIRTPMNAIMGFTELMADQEFDDEQRRHFSKIVSHSSHQLLSIIDDIVRISSIEAGQEKIVKQQVNLNTLMTFIHEQFIQKAEDAGLRFEWIPGLNNNQALIVIDETKLQQIVTNLLVNAFKFTKEGYIQFGYVRKKGVLEFYVKDSGIGIPESMHKKIFQRFSQVENSLSKQYGGSGLGLSICKAYVDLIGGQIWVESAPNGGSSFYFSVPYEPIKHSIEPVDELSAVITTIESKSKTLLVAEDEDLNFLLVKELLRAYNYTIVRAINGVEAVNLVDNMSFDLILMDLKMPVMDGYEATRLIKANHPAIPVIALTAYSNESDKNKALDSGCSEVIVKPIVREYFISRVKNYLKE